MGFLLAFLSACSATAKDIVSKAVAPRVHPSISTFASFAFALPFYILLLAISPLFGADPLVYTGSFMWLVVARSVSDVFAEGLKMKALQVGDISLVSSFLSLSPLFLALVSPIITGDRVSKYDWIALVLIVLGSLVIVRRDRRSGAIVQMRAIVYACLASVAFALNNCFDRLAVVQSGALTAGFSMTLLAAIIVAPMALRYSGALGELRENYKSFLARGAWETLFMVTKLAALQFLEAHVVSGIGRTSLLFTVLAGRIKFGEQETARRVIASLLMYAGLLVLLIEHV
jgi:drug/metabolite transporter (DMT)-like permease